MRASNQGGAVVVVGSLHHDIVVEADRQPLRGETLMGDKWYPKFGGKGGNQAVAAARAGADVHVIGAVGRDSFGDTLIAGLDEAGVDHSGVARLDTGSGMSVAMVDGEGDYAAVVVTGANAAIDAEAVRTSDVLQRASVLLLQNEVPADINMVAAQTARDAGALVVWNAAPMRPDPERLIEMVDVLVVNAVEAEQFCGLRVGSLENAKQAAQMICEGGVDAVVTAGSAGCAWATPHGDSGALPAEFVKDAKAHGAGDVYCGVLAAKIADCSLSESIQAASTAAHRHVSGQPVFQD